MAFVELVTTVAAVVVFYGRGALPSVFIGRGGGSGGGRGNVRLHREKAVGLPFRGQAGRDITDVVERGRFQAGVPGGRVTGLRPGAALRDGPRGGALGAAKVKAEIGENSGWGRGQVGRKSVVQ